MAQETKLHAVTEIPSTEPGTGSNVTEATPNGQPKIKRPIFIGCLESEIVKAVEKFLFEKEHTLGMDPANNTNSVTVFSKTALLNKDEYTLLVINPEVYQGLQQQYLFSELSKEEQERQTRVRQSEELKQQATMQALQIEERIKQYRTNNAIVGGYVVHYYNEHPEELFIFSQSELKTILNCTREKQKGKRPTPITNQIIWNVMDLLLLFGFLLPTEAEQKETKREKISYKLILTVKDRLALLLQQRGRKFDVVEQANLEFTQLNNRIAELEWQIETEQNEKESIETANVD